MQPEIIRSEEVLDRQQVKPFETKGELLKIYASISLVAIALLGGFIVIGIAAYHGKSELQTWAMSLVSAIVGGAIGFGFNSKTGN